MRQQRWSFLGAALLACVPLHAAEWTRTIDLTDRGQSIRQSIGPHGATADAFWYGSTQPINPDTGVPLVPYAMRERIVIEDNGARARSSHRDVLWNRHQTGVDASLVLAADGELNSWGIDDQGRLVRLTVDGAQFLTMTPVSLVGTGFTIAANGVAPRTFADGAWVLFERASGDDHLALIDGKGGVQRRLDVPACARIVADDHLGGAYVVCPQGTTSTVHRFAADTTQSWSITIADDLTTARAQSTPDGNLLIERPGRNESQWHYFTAAGQRSIHRQAQVASAHAGGLWLWSASDARLAHFSSDGTMLAWKDHAPPKALVAHANGNVMIDDGFSRYSVFDRHGQFVHADEAMVPLTPTEEISRIDFNAGEPLAFVPDGYLATLIDRHGQPSSAPFSIYAAPEASLLWKVRASAQTLCREYKEMHPQAPYATPRVKCMDRATGVELGMDVHFPALGNMLDVGTHVRVKTDDELFIYTPQGEHVATIDLRGQDQSVNQYAGAVVARSSGSGPRLLRYDLAGALVFDRALSGDDGSGVRVMLARDGSTIVLQQRMTGPHLAHFAADGSLLGVANPTDWPQQYDIASVESSAHGVQVLLETELEDYTLRSSKLYVYSPDLATLRATHSLGTSWRSRSQKLWATDDGNVHVLRPTFFGLARYHVESATGRMLAHDVLPLDDAFDLTGYFKPYSVDGDGSVLLFHTDQKLWRDVLRIFDAGSAVSGPALRQASLAGAWHTPSATGQGLIIEVDPGTGRLFAAWHTYAPDGGNALSKQQWFTLQGESSAALPRATFPIYRNSGGRFDVAGRTDAVVVGNAELVRTGCDTLELWYAIGDERGAIPMQRSGPRTTPCVQGSTTHAATDAASGIALDGTWFDPTRSGQGFAFATGGERMPALFGGWFTYDSETLVDDAEAQHWFTVQGGKPTHFGETTALSIHRTTGGSRNVGFPTRNTHRIGNAELTVHDCAHATLSYRFDDKAMAGSFGGLARSIPLTRLGPCPE